MSNILFTLFSIAKAAGLIATLNAFSFVRRIFFVTAALFLIVPANAASPYQDPKAPLETRVADLFAQLTPEEKLGLLKGTGFTTRPIPRLGVPGIGMVDGGQGVRGGPDGTQGPATLFPSAVAMASTWDVDLVQRIGGAIGTETLNKGTGAQILLGPAVNIQRSPLGGRNGEYFSEDPYLAGRLAVVYINGLQATGAEACIKHFACNNQEEQRGSIDVHVSERALREIYLPAFEAGVKEGHVANVMSSYNLINGTHASANSYLLTDIAKKEWGFDGVIMSDWGGVHGLETVNAGNDLEMPGKLLTVDALQKGLQDGKVSQTAVDDSVRRIVRMIIRSGVLDGPRPPDPALVNSKEHQKLALAAAEKGIVLLKNDGGVLPIDPKKIHTIAVIGEDSLYSQMSAQGSPHVNPPYKINPLDGLTRRAEQAGIVITSVPLTGATASKVFDLAAEKNAAGIWSSDQGLSAPNPAAVNIDLTKPVRRPPPERFTPDWTGQIVAPETGPTYFNLIAAHEAELTIDGKQRVRNFWAANEASHAFSVDMTAGQSYIVEIKYLHEHGDAKVQWEWIPPSGMTFPTAVAAAQKADMAIVCVGTMAQEGEEIDRPSMDLPFAQAALIRAVAGANKNTVVVLNNGTPVTMKDWVAQVPGIVETWLPGMEGGNALAAILFGDVNPSGKLPTTLGFTREDYPDTGNFPGTGGVENYAEGIFVGYRHFDQAKIAPAFPFGFGLSYTTFAYSNLKLGKTAIGPADRITATVDITNTGARAGEEVAELYVHDPAPKIEKAPRELKGFSRVALAPGETKTVRFDLPLRALAYCDVPGKRWKADAGAYEIEVGASSRDLPQKATLRLNADYLEPIIGMK